MHLLLVSNKCAVGYAYDVLVCHSVVVVVLQLDITDRPFRRKVLLRTQACESR